MSGGILYQHALRVLGELPLPDVARTDLVAALEAVIRGGPAPLMYQAGHDAGLGREALRWRGAAVLFGFAAANLADDLMDGDCTYYAEPVRVGPCAQWLLHNLVWHCAIEGGVSAPDVGRAARALAVGAGPQHEEVRTRQWDAVTFQRVCEGIAGEQWVGWLTLLWSGTPLAARADAVGRAFGVVANTAHDVQTNDPRFTTLSEDDRGAVLAWARERVAALRAEPLTFTEMALPSFAPALGLP